MRRIADNLTGGVLDGHMDAVAEVDAEGEGAGDRLLIPLGASNGDVDIRVVCGNFYNTIPDRLGIGCRTGRNLLERIVLFKVECEARVRVGRGRDLDLIAEEQQCAITNVSGNRHIGQSLFPLCGVGRIGGNSPSNFGFPAEEDVAFTGGSAVERGGRVAFLDGVGLVSECSAVNAIGVGDGELLHFRGGGGVGDVDVNGSFGAAELPLGEGCIPVPRCSLCCGLTVFQIMRTIFAALRVIGIQILVGVERHDANPRIGVLRQNRAVIGNDITKSICVINLGDIIEPCLMVIGITPHVDSAQG